jgi:hypothetical protein
MAGTTRLHLWIPEQEIDNVDKTPQSRSNQYDLQHDEHGQKLSQGLQSVVDYFRRLQASDSIDEQDLITFKVILQDKEDFSAQKDFIEKEGLKINAVKDKTHAIVSAPRDVFGAVSREVRNFRAPEYESGSIL